MKILPLLECVNLTEALNTTFSTQSEWEFKNGEFTSTGIINDEKYRIYVQPISLSDSNNIALKISTTLNIGFAKVLTNNEEVENLQFSKDNKTKVIGAVTNAIKDKVSELTTQFDINFIIMFVVKGEDRRLDLYKMLVRSPMYGLRPWRSIGTVSAPDGTFIVCTKNAGAPPNIDEFFDWLKNNNKTFNHAQNDK